jgi:hypothetical protein
MSEADSAPQVNAESEDSLARAAEAGPPMHWDNSYGDAGDGRPEGGEQPDLMYQIFREPEELQQERGD